MPWLNPQQDPSFADLAARGSISGGGGVSSALLQPRRNPWEELLKTVAPLLKEYMQKKKSDQFKNYLMNMYQPPRAEAVDPALQGLPPTMPFTGGSEQFKVSEMYRKQMEGEEDRDLNRRANWAQINARGESRVPVEIGGQTYHVTPNAALEHFDRARGKSKDSPESRFNKDVESDYGLTSDDLSNLNVESMDFHDANGQPVDQAYANQNPKDTLVVGKAGGKTIRVPYSDWVKLATRYQNLPKQESNPAVQSYQEIQKQTAQGKQLDQATAKAILDEAGGDKEKARQIARDRGYAF